MIVEVALNLPLRQTFDYQWPEDFPEPLCGIRVLVPFGPHKKSGVLVAQKETSEFTRLRKVEALLDEMPVFSEQLLQLTRWVSEFYFCAWGEVLSCAIPGGLGVRLHTSYRRLTDELPLNITTCSPKVHDLLQSQPSWTLQEWKQTEPSEHDQKALKRWIKEEIIECTQTLAGAKTKAKTERWIRLIEAPPAKKRKTRQPTKREKIVSILLEQSEISLHELKDHVATPAQVVKQLKDEGHIEVFEKRVYRQFLHAALPELQDFQVLKAEQQEASDTIYESIQAGGYKTFLLHGVTGSGKTEVYLHAVKATLEQGKQCLILVPEISLTPQLVDRFRARFGNKIAVLHSGMDDGERFDEWSKILQNEVPIAIGARSAIFAPLNNIGLIVVDEEHDTSYKQEDAPRYQGRDVAIFRGFRAKATVVLGSATPSLESWHNVKEKKYQCLSLPSRVHQTSMPEVELINMKKCVRQKGSYFFSQQLVEAMRQRLLQQEQTLIFLNRRGYASLVQCDICEEAIVCPNCSLTLFFHQSIGLLKCHQCDHVAPLPQSCPSCSEKDLKILGIGTEQIESNLQMIFPQARILRIDRDTLRSKHSLGKMLEQIRQHEVDIIVGTQLVTKGHDFPKITLVGVVLADLSLNFPDFRAAERTFQLLTQVAGRAGRGEQPGLVLIQTYNPAHHSLQCAKNHSFEQFQEHEFVLRKELNNAPFLNLVSILFSSTKEVQAQNLASQFHKNLMKVEGVDFLQMGPVEAPIKKLKNRFRWMIVLKATHVKMLHHLLECALSHPTPLAPRAEDRISIDINPFSFL